MQRAGQVHRRARLSTPTCATPESITAVTAPGNESLSLVEQISAILTPLFIVVLAASTRSVPAFFSSSKDSMAVLQVVVSFERGAGYAEEEDRLANEAAALLLIFFCRALTLQAKYLRS